MGLQDQIKECQMAAKSYPDLAKRYSHIGIESYTVDTATSTILYRFGNGEHVLHPGTSLRTIGAGFDRQRAIDAVRNNQQGKTDYPGFMNEIAEAGCRFYEATLVGSNKRVTYIGTGGVYEEAIPWE